MKLKQTPVIWRVKSRSQLSSWKFRTCLRSTECFIPRRPKSVYGWVLRLNNALEILVVRKIKLLLKEKKKKNREIQPTKQEHDWEDNKVKNKFKKWRSSEVKNIKHNPSPTCSIFEPIIFPKCPHQNCFNRFFSKSSRKTNMGDDQLEWRTLIPQAAFGGSRKLEQKLNVNNSLMIHQ